MVYLLLFSCSLGWTQEVPTLLQLQGAAAVHAPSDTPLSTYLSVTFPLNSYTPLVVPHLGAFAVRAGDMGEQPLLRAAPVSYDRYLYNFSSSFVRQGTTVVDVGAKSGAYACPFASLVGDGTGMVYAIEHQLDRFSELLANTVMNGVERISCRRLGLSDQAGWVVDPGSDYPSSNGNVFPTSGPGLVEIARLDDFDLTNVSLIRIDVNGTELEVLDGAEMTLASSQPIVLIVFLNEQAEYPTLPSGPEKSHIDACISWLMARGYRSVYIARSSFFFIPTL
jgi:FkbM family methyltransferase